MKILKLFLLISFLVVGGQAQQKTVSVKLFFGNEKFNPNSDPCNKVFPVTRKIPATKAIATAALEELFKGVNKEEEAKSYTSFSPEETKGILKSVKIKNGAAYVNFNNVVYEQLGTATTSCGGAYFFTSLEKTLKQFPTIKKIFYAIEGKPAEFYDWVQVGECPKELKNCSGKDF